ncbi:MAG: integration host factor subunit beta [Treponema sp.]|jgi:integration host factor subunit beta|nr:integration host factor subunit beta [Treponema sp.]
MSSKKVTKIDLIEAVYEETRLEKKVVQVILESLLDEFKQALKEGSTIELRGFGTFEPRLRKGRAKARNPKTGEHLSVPPHYVAAFRSGRDLKTAMWNLPAPKTGK